MFGSNAPREWGWELLLKQWNIFAKISLLIGVLLIFVLLLYGRSNFVSVRVVEQSIKNANYEQLSYFVSQMDAALRQLSKFTVTLNDDPDIKKFHKSMIESTYMNIDAIYQKEIILQKLLLQSLSASWDNELTVFSPSLDDLLSTNSSRTYRQQEIERLTARGWQVFTQNVHGQQERVFSYATVEPFAARQIDQVKRIIEVRFHEREIRKSLDEFKSLGHRNSFLYHPVHGMIHHSSPDLEFIVVLETQLERLLSGRSGIEEVWIGKSPYIVSYLQSEQLGWYVVDYAEVQEILTPIEESRNYFYLSMAFLIVLSLFATYMLYKHVRLPIRDLTLAVRLIQRGNYSARMNEPDSADFKYLFMSFNRMAEQIENLIQSVLTEKIRTREAELKQLQTQINPHFLFNCFAFIMSMARAGNKEAIMSMTHSLSKYYRFATRSDTLFCKIRDEIEFIRHYLSIHQMRMPRLKFDIHIDPGVEDLEIPKLLIQPLVENAIIHGIESRLNAGYVRVEGKRTDDGVQIVVEDDGGGMDEEAIGRLMQKINGPLTEEMGCGLWNVNQRMNMMFGEGSSLLFTVTDDGRTRVILHIKPKGKGD